MIDEFLLQSAVNIRREYLNISDNMKVYHDKSKNVIKTLEESIQRLDEIEEKSKKDKNFTSEKSIKELIDVIKRVDDEGKKLEDLVEPMNSKIEKLSNEENLLYSKIKEKHPDLTEKQIIDSVHSRLKKEGLL